MAQSNHLFVLVLVEPFVAPYSPGRNAQLSEQLAQLAFGLWSASFCRAFVRSMSHGSLHFLTIFGIGVEFLGRD